MLSPQSFNTTLCVSLGSLDQQLQQQGEEWEKGYEFGSGMAAGKVLSDEFPQSLESKAVVPKGICHCNYMFLGLLVLLAV